MRLSILSTTLATLSLTSARIIGIAVPSTLEPGSPFNLTLLTENYIQSVADIAVAWGYSATPGYLHTLGAYTSSSYLGPSNSNTLKNVTIPATAPAELSTFAGKEVVLSAGVYSLYGANSGPTVANFNVTVAVGNATSDDLVKNNGFTWGTASGC